MMDISGMARMMGITPEQLQEAQRIGQRTSMVIKKYRTRGMVEVHYIPGDDEARAAVPELVDNLAAQVAQGHHLLFGMRGEIQTVREG